MAVEVKRRQDAAPAFQIAPMIDVVFLLLIYFMVSASLQKQEADISFRLPGVAEPSETLEFPDEQVIEIDAAGQVVINEYACDAPGARRLVELTAILSRFRQTCEANQVEPAVTIAPDDAVPHQVVVRVMDACAQAGITQVNFALGEE
ncbi:MAG: biopolymer transporter ExbD [Verrucomicrobia bacterium]|nr:MAG: biopolymer transporter ExbD [Verrucomicrobiota bacterium]